MIYWEFHGAVGIGCRRGLATPPLTLTLQGPLIPKPVDHSGRRNCQPCGKVLDPIQDATRQAAKRFQPLAINALPAERKPQVELWR